MQDYGNRVKNWLEANRGQATQGWFDFLRFRTVGTDPACARMCEACADWLADWLEAHGFSVTLMGEDGVPPVVVAQRAGEAGSHAPAILFYGHYDVQPADTLEGWTSDPWEPTERDGRVYARGAQDDKGQVWWSLMAIQACIEMDVPLPDLTIVLDGQEECGSGALIEMIEDGTLSFRSDVLMVADTLMAEDGRPAITLGLRGVSCITFRLHGAAYDLHSGVHGGLAPNPADELARILASMHGEDGAITVEGFGDGIEPPTADDQAVAFAEPFDAEAYAQATGVPPIGGTRGVDPRIRGSLEPTLEVNGFHSGYAGEGGKTIIPAWAEVKLSMRTVPGQAPESVLAAVRRHVEARVKPGLRLDVPFCEPGASALRISPQAPAVVRARRVLEHLYPRGCVLGYEGASIHVIGALAAAAGATPVLIGFGLESDRIHAPDESFEWKRCEDCFGYTAAFLADAGRG